MTLKEKFWDYCDDEYSDKWVNAEYCEQVADEFAIGFACWCDRLQKKLPYLGVYEFNLQFGNKSVKELLEIYKKEKEL